LIFWVAAVFLLPVSPIWPPRRPFLPYGRPNLALAGLLVNAFIMTIYNLFSVLLLCYIFQSINDESIVMGNDSQSIYQDDVHRSLSVCVLFILLIFT